MNVNEFDIIHNDDENENYFCVDSQARFNISNFDYKITCVVIFPFNGTTTIDNITYNIFSFYLMPSVNYLQGKFSTAYDGACIRCLFDTYAPTMDTSLPFVIQASDQQTPPQPQYYHVYTDFNRQQKMQGLYKRGSVMDFVFDKTNQCFYLVGSVGEMNVQADWNQTNTSADDYIKNKPTIPAAQVNSDWSASSGIAQILNKPNLANVATTGDYRDLNHKPDADDISYDNSTSSLTVNDVQAAIDYLANEISYKADANSLSTVATTGDASDVYIAAIGLNSNNVKDIAEELNGKINDLDNEKQDALTAGDNISILSGVISAVDTKPTNHTNVGSGTVSVANNTWVEAWAINDLPAGEYIVQISVAWQSGGTSGTTDNGTGYRQIEFGDTNTTYGSAGWINTNIVGGLSGIRTCQGLTIPIKPTQRTSYRLNVKQNSGATLHCLPRIRYVKIG